MLSSDVPVAYPNPMEAIYAAVNRVVGAKHQITVDEALKLTGIVDPKVKFILLDAALR